MDSQTGQMQRRRSISYKDAEKSSQRVETWQYAMDEYGHLRKIRHREGKEEYYERTVSRSKVAVTKYDLLTQEPLTTAVVWRKNGLPTEYAVTHYEYDPADDRRLIGQTISRLQKFLASFTVLRASGQLPRNQIERLWILSKSIRVIN